MLCLHASTLICVGFISLHVWEMVLLLAVGRWALIPVVVDIVAARKTIQQVELLFDGVGVRLVLIAIIAAATTTAASAVVV